MPITRPILMKYLSYLILLLIVGSAHYTFAQVDNKAIVMGRSSILQSTILQEERKINIYLPEDYQENDAIKYPVIYVLDGGIEEDFFHIAGIVRFHTQPWIARFPRSIVVGIEGNTRRRDFTFPVQHTDFIEKEGFSKASFPAYGGSERYMDFIEKELQPFIESTYAAAGKKTIIGESLAGLFTTEILLKRPYLFDDYIIISPSLWWGERALLKEGTALLQQHLSKTVHVYLGVPGKEEDVRMFDDADRLHQQLKTHNNIHLVYDYMPDERHSTVMHQAVYNAFKKLYPKTAY